MFIYDKDIERVMQEKKREILQEMEDAKLRILQELSGVDKLTLTRLREIIANHDRIEHSIEDKFKYLRESFAELVENGNLTLDTLEAELSTLHTLSDNVKDRLSPENHHNSEGFISKIIDVVKTYSDNFESFVYGNAKTAYDAECVPVDGKWELDCSSFQNLLLQGVTFDNSRYNGNAENTGNPLFFGRMDSMKYRLANQMAEYFFTNGYTFKPNADFSNIEAGDLVFYSWDDMTGDFHEKAFMHIDHVAMYLGRKNEATHQTIQYESNTPNFIYDVNEKYMKQAVLVARLPFANISNRDCVNIAENPEEVLSVENGITIGTKTITGGMKPGKMYSVKLRGKIETENAYIMLMGKTATAYATMFSNHGETFTGTEKEYTFRFICPNTLTDYNTLYLSIGAPSTTGQERTGSVQSCYVYENYLI